MESPTAVGGGRAQNDAAAAERQGTLGSTLSGLVGQDKQPTPTLRVTGNQMDEDEKERQRKKSEQWAAELRVQMEEQRVQKEKEKQDELERLEAKGACRVVVSGPEAFNSAVKAMLSHSGHDLDSVTILSA